MTRRPGLSGSPPEPWPLPVRVGCALAGVVLLAAPAAGTWREVLAVYARDLTMDVPGPLHLPAWPPPFPADENDPLDAIEAPQRFLVHVLVTPTDFGDGQRPFQVLEIELNWPVDREKRYGWTVQRDGGANHQILNLKRVYLHEDLAAEWEVEMHRFPGLDREISSTTYGNTSHWTSATDTQAYLELEDHLDLEPPAMVRQSLSLVPRRTVNLFTLGLSIHRVAPGDPLRPVSADGVIKTVQSKRTHSFASGFGDASRTFTGGGAILYARHVGLAALPVLMAPLFLAQLRRRRALAFLGALVAVVLSGVASDRWAQAVHIGRLTDPAAPIQERALALDSLETTFFYRVTALTVARRIAKDLSAPELLRRKAEAVASRLQAF